METSIEFDSEQKKDGFNKYGNYQFGLNTCPVCKSEDTDKEREAPETHRWCNVCSSLFGINYE